MNVSAFDVDEWLNKIEIERLGLLIRQYHKTEQEKYEVLAHTISVGYSRTQSKKPIPLFQKNKKSNSQTNTITAEERERKLKEMSEMMEKAKALQNK